MKFISSSILLFALYLVGGTSVSAFPVGTDERGITRREDVGSTITVGGKQYTLVDEVSGDGGAETFKAQAVVGGGIFYAKRPTEETLPEEFAAEVTNTQKASQVLGTNLFVSSGTYNDEVWLITVPAPGGEITQRWEADKVKFATRAACEADMTTARSVIVGQNQKLATNSLTDFVHGDNHPGNWFVPTTGTIQTAVPIDFGKVLPPPPITNIEQLVSTQYTYSDSTWQLFSHDLGICH